MSSPVGPAQVLGRVVATLVGIMVGGVAGFAAGAFWYEATGPDWAQFGYEFEGFVEALIGALAGAVLGGLVSLLVTIRLQRKGGLGR